MSTSIKVTKIKNRWHARLSFNGAVISEMACTARQDIGFICGQLLRSFSKEASTVSGMAEASRDRQKNQTPVDKIWWPVNFR